MSLFPAKTLEIPAGFGQVTERIMDDPSAPALIHIQSARSNYEAEKNIKKLLRHIEAYSSVKLMLLEGAAKNFIPNYSGSFRKIRILTAK